jgi:hypothetical protein
MIQNEIFLRTLKDIVDYKWFVPLLVVITFLSYFSCSKSSEIDPIIGVDNTVTVIKEEKGFYWAIPGAGIDRVEGDKIIIKKDVIVSYGKGEGNIKRISETLRNNRNTQRGSFQATGSAITETINGKEVVTKLYDCFTGKTTEPITLTITDVIDVIYKKD